VLGDAMTVRIAFDRNRLVLQLALAVLILLLPAITNATLYEVDTESSNCIFIDPAGTRHDLTVSGYFETEINNDQLSFVSNGVTFLQDGYPHNSEYIFPNYPATLTGQSFEGLLFVCDGFIFYSGTIQDYSIVFEGQTQFPLCGADYAYFVYHIEANVFQPRDIPQLHLPGILVIIASIAITGTFIISRNQS
jgi:hypothetical protein